MAAAQVKSQGLIGAHGCLGDRSPSMSHGLPAQGRRRHQSQPTNPCGSQQQCRMQEETNTCTLRGLSSLDKPQRQVCRRRPCHSAVLSQFCVQVTSVADASELCCDHRWNQANQHPETQRVGLTELCPYHVYMPPRLAWVVDSASCSTHDYSNMITSD